METNTLHQGDKKRTAAGEKRTIRSWINLENGLFCCATLALIGLRLAFFQYESSDFTSFLRPWFTYISDHPGFSAFAQKFSDYTPPYLYILWLGTALKANALLWIKSVSVFFDLVTSALVAAIIGGRYPGRWKYAFLTTLAIPSVLFNGSWWGQCDSIYGACVLASLWMILKKRHTLSFACFAIGLAIKLQTIFFAPVFVLLAITGNIPKRKILFLPIWCVLAYLIAIASAFFSGWPLLHGTDGLLSIYIHQASEYPRLVSGNIPNLYQWLDNAKFSILYPAGLCLTGLAMGAGAFVFVKERIRNLTDDAIIKLAYVTTLAVPFLLPKMHERYMFLADVIGVVYAFSFPGRWWVFLLTHVIGLSIYVSFLAKGNLPQFMEPQYAALVVLGILFFLLGDLGKSLRLKKENGEC